MKKGNGVQLCRKCGKPIGIISERVYRKIVVDADAVMVAANIGGETFVRQDGTKFQARELSKWEEFSYIVKGFTTPEPAYRPHRCGGAK